MFSIQEYKQELALLHQKTRIMDSMFTLFRVVDPFTRRVYCLKDGHAVPTDLPFCYSLWQREEACSNCISARACSDHSFYMKLEYLNQAVLLVFAQPVELDGKTFALELASDVTSSMLVSDGVHPECVDLKNIIDRINTYAITDTFTNLYNHQYIHSKIEEFTQQADQPLSLAVMDIDCFKDINDCFGHMIGDDVIKKVASVLRPLNDLSGCYAGRTGGDEFAVIFSGRTADEARPMIEEKLAALEAYRFRRRSPAFSIRISCATTEYQPGETARAYLERADRRMYDCKRLHKAQTR